MVGAGSPPFRIDAYPRPPFFSAGGCPGTASGTPGYMFDGAMQIYNGQLWWGDGANGGSKGTGLLNFPGLPTAQKPTGSLAIPSTTKPYGFVFASPTTLWATEIANLGLTNLANYNQVSGTWTRATPTASMLLEANTAMISLVGRIECGGVFMLYSNSPTKLYQFNTVTSTATVIAVAPVNTVFRGVVQPPYVAPPVPTCSSTSTTTPSITATPTTTATTSSTQTPTPSKWPTNAFAQQPVGVRIWLQNFASSASTCLNFYEIMVMSTTGQNMALKATSGTPLNSGTYSNNVAAYANDLQMDVFNPNGKFVNTDCSTTNQWTEIYWGTPTPIAEVLFFNRMDGNSGRITAGNGTLWFMSSCPLNLANNFMCTNPVFFQKGPYSDTPGGAYSPQKFPVSAATSTITMFNYSQWDTLPRNSSLSSYSTSSALPRYIRIYAAPGAALFVKELQVWDENGYNVALFAPATASGCVGGCNGIYGAGAAVDGQFAFDNATGSGFVSTVASATLSLLPASSNAANINLGGFVAPMNVSNTYLEIDLRTPTWVSAITYYNNYPANPSGNGGDAANAGQIVGATIAFYAQSGVLKPSTGAPVVGAQGGVFTGTAIQTISFNSTWNAMFSTNLATLSSVSPVTGLNPTGNSLLITFTSDMTNNFGGVVAGGDGDGGNRSARSSSARVPAAACY